MAQNQSNQHHRSAARWYVVPLALFGSLGLGITVLCLLIALLAWGTLIESEYGPAVSKFVLYGNRWFVGLQAVLAVNLLCAMLLRWPRGRSQLWLRLPFFLAHGGIIILLGGCFVTWQRGLEAQITLAEGHVGDKAIQMNRQHFSVSTISHENSVEENTFQVPFEPGPFNWEDFDTKTAKAGPTGKYRSSLGWAMRWGHRDRGPLPTERPDIQMEVLDYLAASTVEPVPPLELNVRWKKMLRTTTELGDARETPRDWEKVRLELKPDQRLTGRMAGMVSGSGTHAEMLGGERIHFALAQSMTEVAAFLHYGRTGATWGGNLGQLRLYYEGVDHVVDVEQLLQKSKNNERFSLENTPLRIDEVQFRQRGPIIHFAISTDGGEKEHMVLFPDNPEMNVHARSLGVFGSYWVDPDQFSSADANPTENPMLQKLRRPRIDLLQGPDKKLYYRFWNGKTVSETGEIPTGKVDAGLYSIGEGTENEAEIVIERFVPQDLPGFRIRSAPVGRQRGTEQRALLKVSVDGNTDIFWLRAVYPTVVPLPPEPDQVRYVYGAGRSIRLQWEYDTVDLGFGLFLKQFEMRNEPGTRMSSHFSSLVHFVGGNNVSNELQSAIAGSPTDVKISMNRPAVRSGKGRSYRIYQSSYNGPYHPGDFRFHELYDGNVFPWETRPRETLYMSTLSVNDDPGRGLKYLGCFLLVFGTGWFVYRKK